MRIINLAASESRSWPIAKNEKGTLELPNFLLNLDCQGLFFQFSEIWNSKIKQDIRHWKFEIFFGHPCNLIFFFNYFFKFLSFSLVNIENSTPFLNHPGIYTCCFSYSFLFPQPCPPKSNKLPIPRVI